jgi:hypothetical protein
MLSYRTLAGQRRKPAAEVAPTVRDLAERFIKIINGKYSPWRTREV